QLMDAVIDDPGGIQGEVAAAAVVFEEGAQVAVAGGVEKIPQPEIAQILHRVAVVAPFPVHDAGDASGVEHEVAGPGVALDQGMDQLAAGGVALQPVLAEGTEGVAATGGDGEELRLLDGLELQQG